ncbi:hypothetical protein AgCh_008237 [Apium graveolens]
MTIVCLSNRCDASLLLDSTRRTLSEKETDRSFGLGNFRYIETIKKLWTESALELFPVLTSLFYLLEMALLLDIELKNF